MKFLLFYLGVFMCYQGSDPGSCTCQAGAVPLIQKGYIFFSQKMLNLYHFLAVYQKRYFMFLTHTRVHACASEVMDGHKLGPGDPIPIYGHQSTPLYTLHKTNVMKKTQVHECVACVYVCVHVCIALGGQKGLSVFCNWSYRQLWATMQELGVKPEVVSAFNSLAIFPAPKPI